MPKLKRYIDEQITALSGGVASNEETDVIEQHLGWIRRFLGDDSGKGEDLISELGFLTSTAMYLDEEGLALRQSKTFCLKGWMLLKNI